MAPSHSTEVHWELCCALYSEEWCEIWPEYSVIKRAHCIRPAETFKLLMKCFYTLSYSEKDCGVILNM